VSTENAQQAENLPEAMASKLSAQGQFWDGRRNKAAQKLE